MKCAAFAAFGRTAIFARTEAIAASGTANFAMLATFARTGVPAIFARPAVHSSFGITEVFAVFARTKTFPIFTRTTLLARSALYARTSVLAVLVELRHLLYWEELKVFSICS